MLRKSNNVKREKGYICVLSETNQICPPIDFFLFSFYFFVKACPPLDFTFFALDP